MEAVHTQQLEKEPNSRLPALISRPGLSELNSMNRSLIRWLASSDGGYVGLMNPDQENPIQCDIRLNVMSVNAADSPNNHSA